MNGDHLVGRIYNALRGNEQQWQETLFILTFDEHGGFFDPVVPPAVDPEIVRQEEAWLRRQHAKPIVIQNDEKGCFKP